MHNSRLWGYRLDSNTQYTHSTFNHRNYRQLLKSLTTDFPPLPLSDKLPSNLFTCCLRGPLSAQMEDGNVNNPPSVSPPATSCICKSYRAALRLSPWLWLLSFLSLKEFVLCGYQTGLCALFYPRA